MKAYKVDVFLGAGGDRDEIGTYLVWAMTRERAIAVALGHAHGLINAEAVQAESRDEIEYDAVLGPSPVRFGQ